MSTHDRHEPNLDNLVDAIRAEEPSHEEIAAASGRVRERLGLGEAESASPAHIESCAGFQALIPDYLGARLPRESALLLEDHSRECIPCRRALAAARRPEIAIAPAAAAPAERPAYWKLAAAAVLAAVGLVGAYAAWQALPLLGAPPELKVLRVDGDLYQVRDAALVSLRPGMTVRATEALRTAKGSGALVMMDDGSRIEMGDRTELAVAKRRGGSTVRLAGGAIIVEAAPQGSGRLDVRTNDCLVSVKGTIFAVNHGTKGSRVSVVEGSVRVAADGRESLLSPGDQITTSNALTTVGVGEEIAWSRDASRYAELLRELTALRKDLDARVPTPEARYASKLLDLAPDGTVLYVAIPNLTETLVEARKVFDEHLAQSDALQSWWREHMSTPEQSREVDEAFARLRLLGSQLGDEIVIALVQGESGRVRGPIVMAEVANAELFQAMLTQSMSTDGTDVAVTIDGSVARMEPRTQASFDLGAVTPWATSPFHRKLREAYADGASWLFGADLEAMVARAADRSRERGGSGEEIAARWERMGLLDARYVVFERTESVEGADHRAEISFDRPRRGLAGWLAAPSSMGAIDFVSPDAGFAVAAIVKRPEAILTEALSWAAPPDVDLRPRSGTDEDIGGIEALRDLAGTLGGDFAVALDGPVLPVPSWKLAVEVYDASAAQASLERLAAWINERIAADGQDGRLVIETESAGNRTDRVVRFTGRDGKGTTMRYTFVDGYLIAAPSRALLDRAIEQRDNGYTLIRSRRFAERLPKDGHVNLSAVLWENLGPTLAPLAEGLAGVVDADEAREIRALAGDRVPHLVAAYAGSDRITVASRGDAGLGSMLGSIASAHELELLGRILEKAQNEIGAAEESPSP